MLTSHRQNGVSRAALHWLLALALLLGQSLALAHDHEADHADEVGCDLCPYAQQTDGMAYASVDALEYRFNPPFVSSRDLQHFAAILSSNYYARAPPVISC